jgi:hypothetical protein
MQVIHSNIIIYYYHLLLIFLVIVVVIVADAFVVNVIVAVFVSVILVYSNIFLSFKFTSIYFITYVFKFEV